jgi:hypothetical protein
LPNGNILVQTLLIAGDCKIQQSGYLRNVRERVLARVRPRCYQRA